MQLEYILFSSHVGVFDHSYIQHKLLYHYLNKLFMCLVHCCHCS